MVVRILAHFYELSFSDVINALLIHDAVKRLLDQRCFKTHDSSKRFRLMTSEKESS